jgi:type IX secretion system PorP/SprF family membrane protein
MAGVTISKSKHCMKNLIIIVLEMLIGMGNLVAQQSPLYSQYMFNKFLTNPAIAGSEGYTAINLTAREQWLGISDAPKTHSISYQTRISHQSFLNRLDFSRNKASVAGKPGKIGLGVFLYNDHLGLIDQTGLQLTYAYHLEMEDMQLSFGLTASFTQFKINKSKIDLGDGNAEDQLIDNSNLNAIYPDFNFGIYLTTEDYFAGFSVTDMMQSSVKFDNQGLSDYKHLRHYYLMGGYRFKLDKNYAIEPGMQLKSTEQLNAQLDLSVRMYYRNLYWGGISFRSGNSMVAMVGMRYDRFYFGYAYDYSFNSLQSSTMGSHELMVTLKIGKVSRKFKWLERF